MKLPTTYIECCDIMDFPRGMTISLASYDRDETIPHIWEHRLLKLEALKKLLVCRDAYWKMLDDWKPNWHTSEPKFIVCCDECQLDTSWTFSDNYIFAFPTAEVRDEFLENFRPWLEDAKEFI